MNITLFHLILSMLLLLPVGYAFWRLDTGLCRQTMMVVGRIAVSLLVLAFCLHYVFLWDFPWLNLLWVAVQGGVATAIYCRRRWLVMPVYVSCLVCSLPLSLVVLWLTQVGGSVMEARFLIPVAAVMQADSLYVCRHGLSLYAFYRRQHASLDEYLRGNGAEGLEAQRPFVAQAVRRAFVPALSQMLLAGCVFVPSLLVGLLLMGAEPLQATAFLAVLTVGAICCSVAALLLSLYIYHLLKK